MAPHASSSDPDSGAASSDSATPANGDVARVRTPRRAVGFLVVLVCALGMIYYAVWSFLLLEQAYRFAAEEASMPARFQPSIHANIGRFSWIAGGVAAGLCLANLVAMRLALRQRTRLAVLILVLSLVILVVAGNILKPA
jgi:hypothetical protein